MNSTPPAPVVHRRRWLYVGIALLLLVLVYALAGFFGVPALLTSSLQKFTSTHYGRTLSLGDVRFNPFTLTLEVRDAALPGAHGEPPISFRRLRVQLEAASLWRRGASFAEILLEAPSVPILVRPDGSTNLGEFARPFASAPPAPGHPATSSAAQKPLRLFIDRLTLSSGSILYEDRSRPVPFRTELRALGFNLRQFSTVGTSADAFSLDARTELGERLHWNGSFALAPLSSHGTLRIDDLRASTLASYLGPALPARMVSGMLGLEAQYVFSLPESGVALQITLPALTLDRLAVAAAAGGDPPVQLGRLRVSGGHMDLAQRSLGVDHIELDGGTVRAWLDADGLSLSKLLAGGPSPAPAGATAKPWTITVPDIAVRNLELNAEDRRSSP